MPDLTVTQEMVQLIYERIDFVNHGDEGIAEGIAAVLALIEREYVLTPRTIPGDVDLVRDRDGDQWERSPGRDSWSCPAGEIWNVSAAVIFDRYGPVVWDA